MLGEFWGLGYLVALICSLRAPCSSAQFLLHRCVSSKTWLITLNNSGPRKALYNFISWIRLLDPPSLLSSHVMGAMSASPQFLHPIPLRLADQDKWYFGAFTPSPIALCLTEFSSTHWHSASPECGWTLTWLDMEWKRRAISHGDSHTRTQREREREREGGLVVSSRTGKPVRVSGSWEGEWEAVFDWGEVKPPAKSQSEFLITVDILKRRGVGVLSHKEGLIPHRWQFLILCAPLWRAVHEVQFIGYVRPGRGRTIHSGFCEMLFFFYP